VLWHDDAFLLLPGDGFLLVGSDGIVSFHDRFAEAHVVDCPSVGSTLADQWPELAQALLDCAEEMSASGWLDVDIERAGQTITARLFRTDSGCGVGFLSITADRAGRGGNFTLYERALRSVNESVLVTTAEPFDRPGPVIVYVNDAFLRDSGYERHEVIGRSPRIMQDVDADMAARRRFRTAIEKWSPTTVELENVRKDGSHFWVEIDLAPVADESGWFTHWVSVQTDVTERRRAEQEREGRTAMVQAILDSLPSQSVLLGRDGRIVASNEQWRQVWRSFGTSPEPEWVGVDYLDACRRASGSMLGGANDAQIAQEGIVAVLDGTAPSFGLDYEMSVDGASLWHHMEVLPLPGREGAIVTHADITRRRLAEDELGYQASHDLLTGLANREALLARLATALSSTVPFGLILIDLDDFKNVNDAFGHYFGDRLLETVADRLASCFEPQDVVARLGGDEFAVVVDAIKSAADLDAACQRIREALADPVNLDIASVRLSASFGVVASPPYAGDADALLRDADTAMYVSKRAGRDRWTVFHEEQRAHVRARAVSSDMIAAALAGEEFELHFQPFIDLVSGRTVAAEALLRWNHPTEGLLSPGSFLAAIESGPLIEDVGEWVLDRALAVQAAWQARPGFERHLMSVNVSPRQLGRGRLPGLVAQMLDRHGVPPANLGIEILESALLTSGATVEAELRELHDTGVRIAIDDFGTGYSALAYLQTFPVDGVKIDRAFIQRSGSPRGARLLRVAGEIASAVSATSVVEGIETPEQLAAAQAAGVMWGQGYLLGRPAPAGAGPALSVVPI
jgi:diguanylate cyclase (GGDEF)-like protein/PAS domain S-box-containing protein